MAQGENPADSIKSETVSRAYSMSCQLTYSFWNFLIIFHTIFPNNVVMFDLIQYNQ